MLSDWIVRSLSEVGDRIIFKEVGEILILADNTNEWLL